MRDASLACPPVGVATSLFGAPTRRDADRGYPQGARDLSTGRTRRDADRVGTPRRDADTGSSFRRHGLGATPSRTRRDTDASSSEGRHVLPQASDCKKELGSDNLMT
ncbi:hypothetical protein HMPREF0731_0088 [Pseudoroseomonas cervicalis ATCC 49957]|uniref:Uncharacterized protein n=1 Tax=Pseudoroseomonas cervicalis ATCC 49957 TaxID=525371 RepID=D5RG79_9PROT|nr:hypothetical protein HMPREF0731_0088 [Pseudoroseomonas cervicalis ATCC 49957]